MKKILVLIMISIIISMLGACAPKGKSASSASVKVTDENKEYLSKYDKSLQSFLTEMTSILNTFNDSLDGLYTQKYSREQFAAIMTGSIEKSNALVTKVEAVDVSPEIFEAHQNLILLVNRSHQLLLDSIDMANTPDRNIDKDSLRSKYLDIKTEQAKITNQWKILQKQLEAKGSKK